MDRHISFDLDGTLIPFNNEFRLEDRSFFIRLLKVEKLRKGTKELFDKLIAKGYYVHIYTTSYRPQWKIRLMLELYGLRVGRIVTEVENRRQLKAFMIESSKHPPTFAFDIHVDDSVGVKKESEKYAFNCIHLLAKQKDWVNYIINEINIIERNGN